MTSIRRQLVIRLVGSVLVLSLAAGAGLYDYVEEALVSSLDAALSAKAQAVAAMVKVDEGRPELQLPTPIPPEFSADHGNVFFQIWHSNGKVFARSPSLGSADVPIPRSHFRSKEFGNVHLAGNVDGRATRIRFRPVVDLDEEWAKQHPTTQPIEEFTLVLAQNRRSVDLTMEILLTALITAAVALSAGVFGIVSMTVRRGLSPLNRLADEAAALDANHLDHRFDTSTAPAELLPISNRLNELLSGLSQAFSRERRFTSDVAHELRTPIAELRSLAEVATKFPGGDEQAVAYFRDVLGISAQMESTVKVLLALARGQQTTSTGEWTSVDLSAMVSKLWIDHEREMKSRGLEINLAVEDGITIQTDAGLLRSILDNLLNNAAAHTPEKGMVRCTVSRNGFVLENSNAGLTVEDVGQMFQPFWKKDAARSDLSHSGLGLALVAEYARVLGVEVKAEIVAPDLFRVSVVFDGK